MCSSRGMMLQARYRALLLLLALVCAALPGARATSHPDPSEEISLKLSARVRQVGRQPLVAFVGVQVRGGEGAGQRTWSVATSSQPPQRAPDGNILNTWLNNSLHYRWCTRCEDASVKQLIKMAVLTGSVPKPKPFPHRRRLDTSPGAILQERRGSRKIQKA